MVYIESPSTNPAFFFNLALEQYVFDRMDRSQEYFMLWQNDNTVVIGKKSERLCRGQSKGCRCKAYLRCPSTFRRRCRIS